MAANAPERVPPLPEDGWAALREARWEDARARFTAALERAETPDALEGLSWAAWWLDDADAVFRSRERAYSLYRRIGDAAAAARMATWLAVDHLDFHGAWAVARGWFGRARRLLSRSSRGPTTAGSPSTRATSRTCRATRPRRASERRRQPSSAGGSVCRISRCSASHWRARRSSRRRTSMRGCAASTRRPRPRSRARRDPDLERVDLLFPRHGLHRGRRLRAGAAWCDRIAEFAERYGSRYMLAFCRAEYGEVLLWRGRWPEAEAAADGGGRRLRAVASGLGRRPARRPRGGAAAAGPAPRRRSRSSTGRGRRRPRQLCRAWIALDDGEALRAAELAERLLRQLPAGRTLGTAPALRLLVRARVARGELDEAAVGAGVAPRGRAAVGTPLLQAQADVADGLLAGAGGDHERARRLLEDAVDSFQRAGAPFDAAQARTDLATTMLALGRADAAEQEASAALEQLRELGAEGETARAQSIAAAAGRSPAGDGVTPRERDVLRLVADGLTNRQIAERLMVSEHTVHRHVTNILRKLELPSRTAAAAYAVRSGIVDAPE